MKNPLRFIVFKSNLNINTINKKYLEVFPRYFVKIKILLKFNIWNNYTTFSFLFNVYHQFKDNILLNQLNHLST